MCVFRKLRVVARRRLVRWRLQPPRRSILHMGPWDDQTRDSLIPLTTILSNIYSASGAKVLGLQRFIVFFQFMTKLRAWRCDYVLVLVAALRATIYLQHI